MTSLQRSIIAIGALDLGYVAWSALGALGGVAPASLWQSAVAFGLPNASLQVAVILAIYLTILVCGVALLFQRATLAWLNYVLFPLRVLLVLPTLFPLFVGLSAIGVTLPPALVLTFLAVTEALRVIVVRRWSRRTTEAGGVAGAAA